MKKIKLLTSLCSIGTLATITPIVATSCSCSNEINDLEIRLDKQDLTKGVDDELIAYVSRKNGDSVYVKAIDNASSSDEEVLRVDKTDISNYGSGVLWIESKKAGITTLSLKITDKEGHVGQGNFIISVADTIEVVPYKSIVSCDVLETNVLSNGTKEVEFDCKFYDENYNQVWGTVKWELELYDDFPSDKISTSINDGKLTIKVNDWTSLDEIKQYRLAVKGQSNETTLSGAQLGWTTLNVYVVPYNINIIKYDGEQIKLQDNIDPNIFSTITQGTTLTKKDGTTLTLDDLTKVEALSIQSVSSQWNKEIDDYFLYDYDNNIALENLSFLDISGLNDVTTIGQYFLYDSGIRSFDGSELKKLEKIGDDAFKNCYNLDTVVFKNNEKLTYVGYDFCYYCRGLNKLNISGWTNVEYIGYDFAYECQSLHEINLNALSNLITQEYNFYCAFCYCYGLKKVVWTKETSLTKIEDYFCYECYSLSELDVSGWKNVETIGYDFLDENYAMSRLDLRSLTSLKYIGDSFLYECYGLKELWLPYELDEIPALGGWGGPDYMKIIHCGTKLDAYKNAENWSVYADLMVE